MVAQRRNKNRGNKFLAWVKGFVPLRKTRKTFTRRSKSRYIANKHALRRRRKSAPQRGGKKRKKEKKRKKGRKKCQMPSSFQRPRYLKTGFEGEISCRTEETSSGNICGSLLLQSWRGEVDESMRERERERERNQKHALRVYFFLLIATSERSSRTVCRYARETRYLAISCHDDFISE